MTADTESFETALPIPASGTFPRIVEQAGDDIHRAGVSSALLAAAGVRTVEADEASDRTGYASPGLLIPYHNTDGSPLLVKGKEFCRLRLRNPSTGAKYLSPRGSGSQVYFPLGLRTLLVPGCALGVVEGEFKSLALVEAGFACVGIGGISSACPRAESGEPELLPDLAALIAQVRPSRVAFIGDADTSLIPEFSRESVKLAKLLRVPVVLPRISLDAPGKGPDDLREIWGEDFPAYWQTILAAAEPVTPDTKPAALAVRLLRREAVAFAKLDADALDKARARLVKLGVGFRNEALAFEEIAAVAASVAGLGKQVFRSAVREESARQSAAAKVAHEETVARKFSEDSAADPLFFDGRSYWRMERDGSFGQLCREDARLHLGVRGFNLFASDGEPSAADRALHQLQVEARVNYAGPICGRPPGLLSENGLRILVTRGPTHIAPKAGACPTVTNLVGNLFGRAVRDPLAQTQSAIFIAWLKLARLAVRYPHEHRPGQVLALVGPPDCGKSLLQAGATELATRLDLFRADASGP